MRARRRGPCSTRWQSSPCWRAGPWSWPPTSTRPRPTGSGRRRACNRGAPWRTIPPVTEAILLVGGQGTRLRPLTINTPKPMLPVAGVPCTEHQIARAREAGVTRIILGTSYKAEVFRDYFGDGAKFGVELVYAVEDHPMGTGGAIRHVSEHL